MPHKPLPITHLKAGRSSNPIVVFYPCIHNTIYIPQIIFTNWSVMNNNRLEQIYDSPFPQLVGYHSPLVGYLVQSILWTPKTIILAPVKNILEDNNEKRLPTHEYKVGCKPSKVSFIFWNPSMTFVWCGENVDTWTCTLYSSHYYLWCIASYLSAFGYTSFSSLR